MEEANAGSLPLPPVLNPVLNIIVIVNRTRHFRNTIELATALNVSLKPPRVCQVGSRIYLPVTEKNSTTDPLAAAKARSNNV
jgi:hypothetical protein